MTQKAHDGSAEFRVSEAEGVLVVTFTGPKVTLDAAGPLYRLVEGESRGRLVLNFEAVEVMSSAPIGVLFNLRKKAEAVGGAVRFCRLSPDLLQILQYVKADTLFGIDDTEQDAIAAFRSG